MADRTRQGRRWPLRVGLGLLGAGAAVLAVELVWRQMTFGPRALSPAGMNSIRPLGQARMLQASEHWELHYELRPNLHTRFKLASFHTNSKGLRDDECAVPKPPETFRVAFVGDSFTMGSGVELEEVFHSRLEALWRARAEGLAVECLNFGVGGYNLLSYAGLLEHRVFEYAPDLVVVGLVSNDLTRPQQQPDGPAFESKPVTHPFWRLHALASLAPSEALASSSPAGPAGHRRHRLPSLADRPDLEAEQRQYVDQQLSRLVELCERAHVPLALCYLEFRTTRNRKQVARRLRDFATEAEVPFFDALPLFADSDPQGFMILPSDPHPNPAAHAIYARGIGRFLLQADLLPDRLSGSEKKLPPGVSTESAVEPEGV
ncbi:MAG: SGNH/GDSL hydrolase family protein [Planctomycetota bacterium]